MGYKSCTINTTSLTTAQKTNMYQLMGNYYENLSQDKFLEDLKTKEKIILLMDGSYIYGFTTIELMRLTIDGTEILGVFSGNTIVDQTYPLGIQLQQTFIKYIYGLMQIEERPLYWLLICKGYMTYKYMSMYFNDYYPMRGRQTPYFEKKIMDSYAVAKYGKAYDPSLGVVANTGFNDFLREGVAPIDDRMRQNPIVSFFESVNPGHQLGDELVCTARFSEANLKKAFFRIVNR